MLLNNSENEKLFAKSVPVSVRDVYTNQTRINHLFLTLEWQDTCAGMYSRKVLVISLTDNDDPFFLYNLHMSEEDFQMLKASQDLLINFASFPQHIIDYIETCLLEERNPQPKFLLVFTVNEKLGNVASPSQLDIIETNQFKNLTHLSLKFVAATESVVRQYLVSCFRSLKDQNRQLQNNLSVLEQDSRDKLASCQHSLRGKDQELELLKKEHDAQLTMKDSRHALELQEERNRLINLQKEEESRTERERQEKEHNFRKQIQQLEAKVSRLNALNRELQDKNCKHESTIRELRSTILSLEDKEKKLNGIIENLRLECEDLHYDLRGKKSEINHLKEKISDNEQELSSSTQTIKRLKEQIDAEDKQLKSIKVELDSANLQLEISEKSCKMMEEEKSELNKIIMKLQEKTKLLKSRLEHSAKDKKKIEEQETLLLDLKKETAELNINLRAKDAEVKSLTISVDSLQKEIRSLEEKLIAQKQVNNWLQKSLTDNCIVPQHLERNLEHSPSSVAEQELARINSGALRKSAGSGYSPTATTGIGAQRSVRIETPTSGSRKNTFVPSRSHRRDASDSAYCTFPSDLHNEASPSDPQSSPNMTVDQRNYEIDSSALSAAFGNGDHIIKHSTAKKATKAVRSATPKPTKKR